MGLAVYPRASFALGVEGSFACACTANVPGAGMGARDVGSGIGHRGESAIGLFLWGEGIKNGGGDDIVQVNLLSLQQKYNPKE